MSPGGLTTDEINALPLGDAYLTAISWTVPDAAASPDLSITVATAERVVISLIFEWATAVVIGLDCRQAFPVLTWDVRFSPREQGGWKVVFDFGHGGSIAFQCNGVRLATSPLP